MLCIILFISFQIDHLFNHPFFSPWIRHALLFSFLFFGGSCKSLNLRFNPIKDGSFLGRSRMESILFFGNNQNRKP